MDYISLWFVDCNQWFIGIFARRSLSKTLLVFRGFDLCSRYLMLRSFLGRGKCR